MNVHIHYIVIAVDSRSDIDAKLDEGETLILFDQRWRPDPNSRSHAANGQVCWMLTYAGGAS